MELSKCLKSVLGATALGTGLGLAMLLSAQPAAAADFGNTSVSGKMYFDLTNLDNKDDATGKKSDGSGFGADVKRFYVGVGYKFDDMWSASIVTDIGDNGANGKTNKRYDVFVKKAYIQAKISPAAVFRLGSADLPWVPFVEGLYGYRYVENVLIDRIGFGTSADWGVHFGGTSGIANYAASVVNGRGYSDPTRSKSVDVSARVAIEPVKGFTLGAGAYSGKLGKETDSVSAEHTATRYNAVVDYRNEHFHIGGSYFSADNYKNVTTSFEDKADGYSAWFSVPVNDKIEIFGRYDSAKTSKDQNPDLKDTYYNAGVQYHPVKPLVMAFAYKHQEVDSGFGGSINGVGSSTPHSQGKSDEIGVWMQFKW